MRQRTTVLFVVGVALLAVSASVAAAAATGFEGASDPVPAATGSGGDVTDVAPGQRLTGVVGAQRAEVEGEIETRAFGIQIAVASSSRAKADVVATEVNDLERRLDALQERRAALERARENGSVSDAAYHARVTELVVRIESVQRRVNATDDVANDLPREALDAAGVDQSNIDRLRQRSTNVTDEETANLVRSIVGEGVGRGMGDPASNVLESVESDNLTTDFIEENRTRTDAPGREDGRSAGNATAPSGGADATPGANSNVSTDTNANASVGVDANVSEDDADADVDADVNAGSDDERSDDEGATNETPNRTAATGTNETAVNGTDGTAAARSTTPQNATETAAGTPPNAPGRTNTSTTNASPATETNATTTADESENATTTTDGSENATTTVGTPSDPSGTTEPGVATTAVNETTNTTTVAGETTNASATTTGTAATGGAETANGGSETLPGATGTAA